MKHTAEEVRVYAEALREALRMHRAGRSTMMALENSADVAPDMLTAYADMIERAEKGVTDRVVAKASERYLHAKNRPEWHGDPMRAALLAVWPAAEPVSDVSFSTVDKVVKALCRIGHSFPESQEEQAARFEALVLNLCRSVQSHFDQLTAEPVALAGSCEDEE